MYDFEKMRSDTYDLERIAEYIKKCKWNWARTMMAVPHEYINRFHCELTWDEFYYIVHAQRDIGVHEQWGRYNLQYLYIDGYKYWTMGDTFDQTWILNRQKVFNEFDQIDDPIEPYYSNRDLEMCSLAVKLTFPLPILEAGCGDGVFARKMQVNNKSYKAVDPSKKAVARFRDSMSGFYRNIAATSFEEAIEKWRDKDVTVIATFGTASYIMHQYLEMLASGRNDYFLMFYKEGFCPAQFSKMHHFEWTKEEIKKMFPRANIYTSKEYYTVSSKPIEWDKIKQMCTEEDELFSV